MYYDSIEVLGTMLRDRETSAVAITQSQLSRIASHDGELQAFASVLVESALTGARIADREIAAGKYRGPLHGVTIAL